MRRGELPEAARRADLTDFEADPLREFGIPGKGRPPARFGECASELKAHGSQFMVRLAAVNPAVVDAHGQRRAIGLDTDFACHHDFALYP